MTIAPSTATAPLRVVATGSFPVDVALCEELSHRRDVALVGLAADVRDAAQAFAADPDVVLLWVDDVARARVDLSEVRKHTSAPAILVASSATPDLLEAAGRMEVADVIVAGQPIESVAFAITKAAHFKASVPQAQAPSHAPSKGRIITVFSPKGGTGKTAVSTNLAVALAHQQGLETLLVDLDLQFGDAALTLGLEPAKTLYDLAALPVVSSRTSCVATRAHTVRASICSLLQSARRRQMRSPKRRLPRSSNAPAQPTRSRSSTPRRSSTEPCWQPSSRRIS